LCDYVYVLDSGHVLTHGTPSAVQRDPQVIATYLGEPREVRRAG
jgi:branched-chain amino acid transport system ATP-binding protein